MERLTTLIDILFAGYLITGLFTLYLYIKLARVKKEIENIHEWADTVDEFMDSEYIMLEIDNDKH
jgi:uncharacterized membrane protein YciS (DUF1049 family)